MAIYTVKTYYKKSCEQHEYFYNRNIKGAEIIVKDGYRFAEFTVETDDDEFPEFDFTNCPGGSADLDSVDLFSCFGSNVENTELVEMFDGGCWGDIEIKGIDDEDEVARLTELIEEEGSYALEEDGDGGWYLSDTECWVWGPLEVTDAKGNSRIICADAHGNMIDFLEKSDDEYQKQLAAEEIEIMNSLPEWLFEKPEIVKALAVTDPLGLTDWFNVDQFYPTRKGTYQVKRSDFVLSPFPTYAEWNGKKWSEQVISWRGFLNKPKA